MKMTYQVFICNPTEVTKMEKILKMLTGDEGLGPYTHTETFAINERESYCTYVVVCTDTIKRMIQEYTGMHQIG